MFRLYVLALVMLGFVHHTALAGVLQYAHAPFYDQVSKVQLVPYIEEGATHNPEAVEKNVDPSLATLAPATANFTGLDEVIIREQTCAVLSSQSSWEDGFENLVKAFRQLDEIVMGAGVDVDGRPFAIFTQTDETGFQFEAMLPVVGVEADPKAEEALKQAVAEYTSAEKQMKKPVVKFGKNPSGRAYRFVHRGAYDDIDTAYEAITTYLDNKDMLVNDIFIEEYVTDLTSPDNADLEVYIYVQPQKQQGSEVAAQPQHVQKIDAGVPSLSAQEQQMQEQQMNDSVIQ